jgi:hypothetical protein
LLVFVCTLPGLLFLIIGLVIAAQSAPSPQYRFEKVGSAISVSQGSTPQPMAALQPARISTVPVLLADSGSSMASVLSIVGAGLEFFGVLIAMYLVVRLGFYSEGLILDKEFGAMDAWRLSGTHQFGLILFLIVTSFIGQVGLLLCLVGVFFTAPFAFVMHVAAYLAVVGKLREAEA